jgi:predicted nucleic acid-binding protein
VFVPVKIYVETNFVLELVFDQEQSESCEQILALCTAGQAQLVLPAYSLAEPHETLVRKRKQRQAAWVPLDLELSQLARTAAYRAPIQEIQAVAPIFQTASEDESQRFADYRQQLLQVAEIIPLSQSVLEQAANCELAYNLSPQDALVYASVAAHLARTQPLIACFLNRNSRDFDTPDILEALRSLNCRMIPRFDHGYRFIQTQITREN